MKYDAITPQILEKISVLEKHKINLFSQMPFLHLLSQDQMTKLFSFGKIRKVSSGKTLIEEGTKKPIILGLLEGSCQVYKLTSERGLNQFREVVLQHTIAPAIFGEMSFLEDSLHSTSVVTTTPCILWELRPEAFQKFLNGDVNLGTFFKQSLSCVVAQRLRKTEMALAAKLVPKDMAYLNRNETSLDEEVRLKIIEAIRADSLSRYPDALSEELIQMLSDYVGFFSDWLMVCPGSAQALDIIARTYSSSGKKITIVSPTFEVFPHCVKTQGASIDTYFYSDPFKVDVADFLKNTDPASDVIYIANPGNPTGLYHTPEEITQIANARPQALFVIDEAYIEFGGKSVIGLLKLNPKQFIITRTLSKAFGLAGFRIGYIIGHPKLLAPIRQFLIPYSTSRIAQIAAGSVLSNRQQIATKIRVICKQRDRMAFELRTLGYRVEVGLTNFILLFVAEPDKALSFFRRHNVLVSNSSSTYLGQCLRISVRNETETSKVIALARKWKNVSSY
jgi:histidinol-phosphate aminotransferase